MFRSELDKEMEETMEKERFEYLEQYPEWSDR